ncbi:MAG: penicillin-insensitive murein endopeptidase [Myxococcota bacterium]|nr:penicillin-insensitive murein endopeptidase [Myxococcota bacterium]
MSRKAAFSRSPRGAWALLLLALLLAASPAPAAGEASPAPPPVPGPATPPPRAAAAAPAPSTVPARAPARDRPARPAPAKARPSRPTYHHYRHQVLPGETLGQIARRYGVQVAHLQRWNDLEGSFVREGQQLQVYTRTPVRARREITHRVRPGETVTSIAKKYEQSVATLARLNRLDSRGRLRAGQTLRIVVEGPEQPSISRGTPQDGQLLAGEQLPAGAGYRVRFPSRAWGTNSTITCLLATFREMNRRFPGSQAAIGDLSKKGGGYLPPHASHQNGKDVDISVYLKGHKKLDTFVRATPRTLDAPRNLALLEALVATGKVQYIFLDYDLQRVLVEEARKQGWPERKRQEWFQYPRGRGVGAIVMHESGHADHLHVRFER